MTTYNTGNPVGSTDARDLSDNAQNLDIAVNGAGSLWTDRLGNVRPTWNSLAQYAGPAYDASTYGSLEAAIDALGVGPATIQYSTGQTVTKNWTIPAGVELMPLNGAVINHGAFTISYAGSTARWPLAQVFNGTGTVTLSTSFNVFPEWWGAIGDGSTDDSAAIQTAVLVAAAYGGVVVLQSCTYAIKSNITFPAESTGKIKIRGSGINSQLKGFASAGVTRILDFGTNVMSSVDLRDFTVNGAGDGAADASTFVAHGIYSEQMSHSRMINVRALAFSSTGATVRNGWSNYFENLLVQYCTVGFVGRLAFNQNTFVHCKFWLNQVGSFIGQGAGNSFLNCLFESNAKAGAFLQATYAASFDSKCYFEGNGKISPAAVFPAGTTAGIACTTPATTIKADIVLDGGSTLPESGLPTSITAMAIFAPCKNVTISASTSVYASAAESMIYAIGCDGLQVENCFNTTTSIPLLRAYQNGAHSKLSKVTIGDNEGFSAMFAFDGATDGRRAYNVMTGSIKIKSADRTNYAETNFLKWTNGGAIVGTFTRKNIADRYGKFSPVWELAYANIAATEIRGFQITPADYPNLVGKTFVFLLDIKAASAGTSVNLYGKTSADGAFAVTTDWATYAIQFTWPAAGGPFFMGGLSKSGSVGSVYVANPVLVEIGADYPEIVGRGAQVRQFYAAAAPLAGDWLAGDVVWNTAPAGGATPGWVCTVAGTPGTWNAMANLAA